MSRPVPAIAHLAIAALIFIAAWSPVDALPAVDAVVPEPDSGRTVFDPHAEAVATFQLLQAQGKDENDCDAFADSIISDVKERLSAGQDLMNSLSDGSECAAKGREDVTNAQLDHEAKIQDRDHAQTARTKARNAPVDFPAFNLNTLEVGQCNQFYDSAEYWHAITARTNAEKAKTQADDAVVAAESAVDNAMDAAAQLQLQCYCDAKKEHDDQWRAVQSSGSVYEQEWAKAHHLKCLSAGDSTADCVVPDAPTVDDKPLVGEAANAECANVPPANEPPANEPPANEPGAPCMQPYDAHDSCMEDYNCPDGGINGNAKGFEEGTDVCIRPTNPECPGHCERKSGSSGSTCHMDSDCKAGQECRGMYCSAV